VWALAVVIFQALAGRSAFEGADMVALQTRVLSSESPPDIRTFRPDASAAIAAFFDAALARDLDRRLADTTAFAAAIRRLRDEHR
jgi:hypothetical protein